MLILLVEGKQLLSVPELPLLFARRGEQSSDFPELTIVSTQNTFLWLYATRGLLLPGADPRGASGTAAALSIPEPHFSSFGHTSLAAQVKYSHL